MELTEHIHAYSCSPGDEPLLFWTLNVLFLAPTLGQTAGRMTGTPTAHTT